ncbi:MAG: hypothetical protein WAV50_00605 [Minisyncoccia bacterium]
MATSLRIGTFSALALSTLAPLVAFAQGINVNAITPYSNGIITLINTVFVPVLFAIAFLYFLWGVYKYFILGADNDSERTKGRDVVLWGLIGFAVILSVWGLVNVVVTTFNLGSAGNVPGYPTL